MRLKRLIVFIIVFACALSTVAWFPTSRVIRVLKNTLDMSSPATNRILLPTNNDAASPTFAIDDDGDTGFYSSADDIIHFSVGGAQIFYLTNGEFSSSNGGSIFNESPSAYNPTIVPSAADGDTGLGRPAADQLSAVAGQVEVERFIEDSGAVSVISKSGDSDHGGYIRRVYAASSGTLDGATDKIELNIPSGWRILICQLHVKTAVVDDGGDDTWSSELNDGAQEEVISAGSAAAQNTNVNHWADEESWGTLTDAETDILLTPNGGSFTAGEIEAHCFCLGFDPWVND